MAFLNEYPYSKKHLIFDERLFFTTIQGIENKIKTTSISGPLNVTTSYKFFDCMDKKTIYIFNSNLLTTHHYHLHNSLHTVI